MDVKTCGDKARIWAAALAALLMAAALAFAALTPAKAFAASVNATALSVGSTYTTSLDEGEVQYFSFTPTATGAYLFETDCSDSDDDTYVYLYDKNLEELGYNDDRLIGLDSALVAELQAGTTYYYSVETFDGDATAGTFEVSLTLVDDEWVASGVTMATGGTDGEYYKDEYYVYEPTKDGLYEFTIDLVSDEGCDAWVYVWDAESVEGLDYAWAWADEDDEEDSGSCAVLLEAGHTYVVNLGYYGDYYPTVTGSSAQASVTDISSTSSYDFTSADGSSGTVYLSWTPTTSGLYTLGLSDLSGSSDDCSEIYVETYDSSWGFISDSYAGIDYGDSYEYSGVGSYVAGETYYLVCWLYNCDDAAFSATLTLESLDAQQVTLGTTYEVAAEGSYESTTLYYSFTPTTSGTYTIVASLEGDDDEWADFDVSLYDSSWDYLAGAWCYVDEEDSSDSGSDKAYLTAGKTYYLEVYLYASDPDSMTATFTVTSGFTDVSASKSYYDAVYALADLGYVTGTTATTFSPDGEVTRAQMVAVLWRIMEPDAYADYDSSDYYNETSFTDVEDCKYYTAAVEWAVDQGITTGRNATTFDPYGTCTFQEFCTFLARAIAGSDDELSELVSDTTAASVLSAAFTDASSVATWADNAIALLATSEYDDDGNVLVGGYTDGTVRPTEVTYRWRMALLVYRALLADLL